MRPLPPSFPPLEEQAAVSEVGAHPSECFPPSFSASFKLAHRFVDQGGDEDVHGGGQSVQNAS